MWHGRCRLMPSYLPTHLLPATHISLTLNTTPSATCVPHTRPDPSLREVADISDAYKLLSSTLGVRGASVVFAVALLLSGQNATVTATLAGQVRRAAWWREGGSEAECCRRQRSLGVPLALHRSRPYRTDMDAHPCHAHRYAPPLASHAPLCCPRSSPPSPQVVMEGFLQMKLKPWVRRLVTRGIAIVPALVVAAVMGQRAVGQLLLVSQVVLSLQLSFAVVPLVHFTSSQAHVGRHANGWFMTGLAILLALLIAGLNGYLLVMVFMGKSGA